MRGFHPAVAVVAAATLLATACGEDRRPAAANPAAASAAAERVVSGTARVGTGRRGFVLLALPTTGRLLVDCTRAGVSVRFRADHLLATADVVVARAGAAPVGATLQPDGVLRPTGAVSALQQTWQIAPFAKAGVRLTTLTVSARRLPRDAAWGCAAAARATLSRDLGATREG